MEKTPLMDKLKKFYHLFAVLAVLNLLAIAGGVGYLVSTGMLTKDKVLAITDIVRPPTPDDGKESATGEAADQATETATAASTPTAGPVERELARLNLERIIRSAEDRQKYASRVMVDIERRRDELEKQQAQATKAREQEEVLENTEAFQKDIEVLSLLKPKVALDSILVRPIDEAARVMLALDDRAAKKIIEAASKNAQKWTTMQRVLERMREPEFNPDDATASATP